MAGIHEPTIHYGSSIIPHLATAGVGLGIEVLTRTIYESYGDTGMIATCALSVLGSSLFAVYALPILSAIAEPVGVDYRCLFRRPRIYSILVANALSTTSVAMGLFTNEFPEDIPNEQRFFIPIVKAIGYVFVGLPVNAMMWVHGQIRRRENLLTRPLLQQMQQRRNSIEVEVQEHNILIVAEPVVGQNLQVV